MNQDKKKFKQIAIAVTGFFILAGTYNAVVINAESQLGSEIKYAKRLDEIYGVIVEGREVAGTWHKLTTPKAQMKVQRPAVVTFTEAESLAGSDNKETYVEPAVMEELNLSLVEVLSKKQTVQNFSGTLSTHNGVIENLSVNLPQGNISVSFAELTGNVFEYDLNGEIYSGMMYQVDEKAYMVSLTNGPLEGTSLRFSTESPSVQQQDAQDLLAQNHQVEIGTFGQETPNVFVEDHALEQQENLKAQGFDFNQGQTL